MSPDRSLSPADVGRSVAVGLWTWVAFALVGASVYAGIARELPAGAPVPFPTSFGDAFVAVLTGRFGESLRFRESAWGIVAERVGETALLVVGTAVVTAALAGGLFALARTSERGRRAVAVAGYVGALPAMAWLFGLRWIAAELGHPILAVGNGGPLSYWPALLALAVPLAAVAARVIARESDGGRIDGWLFLSWFLGALVFVEATLGLRGIGGAAIEGVGARDPPVFVGAASVLAILAVLATVVRELIPPAGGSLPLSAGGSGAAVGRTDGAGRTDVGRGVRERFRVRVGMAAVVAVGVAAVVGRVAVDPSPEALGPDALSPALAGLSTVAATAALTGVVAALVGVPFGFLLARSRYARVLLELTLGWATNLPLLVLLVLVLATDPSSVGVGVVAGLAVAAPVARTAARDLDGRTVAAPAALVPAVGVAVLGAGVAALVAGQYHALGQSAVDALAPNPSALGGTAFRAAVAIAPPAIACFLLADGLRSVPVGDAP